MNATVSVACDYCSLPVPYLAEADPALGARLYCCYGCRFAAAVTAASGEEGAARWALARLGMAIFLSMNVMVFTMALWTNDFYDDPASLAGHFPRVLRDLFRYLSLLFALPVLFLLGGPLLQSAWDGLRQRLITSDLLLVLGVAAAYLYSAISVLRDEGPVYFEVGCGVLVLVTLGRWLEATGKLRAVTALDSLQRLLPESVRRVTAGGAASVPLTEVKIDDVLHVLAGERIPCDGRVERRPATVDEQVVTGESRPVVKEPGDRAHAGSLNLESDLLLRVTAPANASSLARLIDHVKAARLVKSRAERLADRVAMVFVPLVMVIAVLTLAWHTLTHDLGEGILAGLAVLLIACPCALGLATPLAVWAALDEAARAGVFFRNGAALERLAAVRSLRLDKTGTLTTGTPIITACLLGPHEDAGTVRPLAGQIAGGSTHCYARALQQYAGVGNAWDGVAAVRTLPGRGLVLDSAQHGSVWLGSPRLLDEMAQVWPEELAAKRSEATTNGQPVTGLSWGGRVRALFIFAEELRPESVAAVAQLRELGLDLAILTGDSAAGGSAIGRKLGLVVQAQLLPEDKVAALHEARRTWKTVAMVGDGINDAPALAAADVGIALGCGADVTRDSAALCLTGNDLLRLPWTITLARRTVRVIRQNLFWAFAYNGAGIALACTGRLNPVVAALAMVVSSFLVVANSLRGYARRTVEVAGYATGIAGLDQPLVLAHTVGEERRA